MADQWEVKKIHDKPDKLLMKYDSDQQQFVEWTPVKKEKSNVDLERIAYQGLGGMVGGTLASPGALTTPIGIGLGSAAGGQIYDIKEEFAGKLKAPPLQERFKSAGEDFALDVVSPVALSKGIYAGKKLLGSMINKPVTKLFRPSDMAAYRSIGIKPTAAAATQSRPLMVMENALSDYPFSAGVMQRSAQYNINQLKMASEYLAKEYGPILTKEEAGKLLKTGAKEAIGDLDNVFKKLFTRIAEQIGPDPQKINNTINVLKTLKTEAITGPSTGIKSIADEIVEKAQTAGGGLPFEALKKYRSYVGDLMKDPHLVSNRNIQSGDLKRLYGALTRDMEQAALKAGPKSHASWRAANKYFEVKLNRDIPILEEIMKKGYDEEAWNIAMKSSQIGGSRLRLLKKQMPEESWNAVAGTVLGKLGSSTPGAQSAAGDMFSISTFLTNWNRLAPEAKTALWGGTKYQALSKELDKLAAVVGDFKSIEAIANKSKTGSVLMFFSLFQTLGVGAGAGYVTGGAGGIGMGIAAAVPMAVAPHYLAKLMTNQGFVKWLAQGVKIGKTAPSAMSVHLGRLFVLREKEDPATQEAIDELIRKIPLVYM